MKLRIDEMREIAKQLPIGYYLGRKTPVVIEESGGAFCDIVRGNIHIGMDLLQQAADNITPSDNWDRESLLRCLLYHEIGHLILSRPAVLSPLSCNIGHQYVNTFEDERLECILA
jgi:hypothetical protein